MDLATIIGLVLGAILVGIAVLMGGSVSAYIDPPSAMIVVGGALASSMAAFPLNQYLNLPKVFMKCLFAKPDDPLELIKQVVELAEVARRDGILALENMTGQINNEFLISGISMAVDGSDPDVIEAIMETELENLAERHATGKALLDAIGRFAPAFGMIGTLIGLVAMLSNMDDPSAIGAGMAAALLTTLYGAMLSNMLVLPLADKLAARSAEEVLLNTIIIQGVMAIQSGDNPRNVESKLNTFLPPSIRPAPDEAAA